MFVKIDAETIINLDKVSYIGLDYEVEVKSYIIVSDNNKLYNIEKNIFDLLEKLISLDSNNYIDFTRRKPQ